MTPEQKVRRGQKALARYHTDAAYRERQRANSRAREQRLKAARQTERAERMTVVRGLLTQMQARGYSFRQLERLTGVPRGSLSRALSGESTSVDPSTEEKIIAAYARLGARTA